MSESTVQNCLYFYFSGKRHEPIVPNTHFHGWESDLISCTRAKLVHDVEIKCSPADFGREFDPGFKSKAKKTRHLMLDGCWSGDHNALSRSNYLRCPNYFWVALEGTFASTADVPDYAGLIYVFPERRAATDQVLVVREAPRIHGEKPTRNQMQKMMRGLQIRYWKQRIS